MTHITHLVSDARPLFLKEQLQKASCVLYILRTTKELNATLHQLECLFKEDKDIALYGFPEWDCLPYDRVSPGHDIVSKRLSTLMRLAHHKGKKAIIVTTLRAWMQRVLPKNTLKTAHIVLKGGNSYVFDDLIKKLHLFGYRRQSALFEAGEFSVRGSIIDIFPNGLKAPVRLDFFDDHLERMDVFDIVTQKRRKALGTLTVLPTSEILLDAEGIKRFRQNYIQHFHDHKGLFYDKVSEGVLPSGVEHLLPLFYDSMSRLDDYVPFYDVRYVIDARLEEEGNSYLSYIKELFEARSSPVGKDHPLPALPPEHFYVSKKEWQTSFNSMIKVHAMDAPNEDIDYGTRPYGWLKESEKSGLSLVKEVLFDSAFDTFVFTYPTKGIGDRMDYVLKEYGIHDVSWSDVWPTTPGRFLVHYPVEESFSYHSTLVISDMDLLGKRARSTSVVRQKKSLNTLNHISLGDLIVHREHGIGQYAGMQTVGVSGQDHDCLILHYDGGDKLFLPVENMDLISRFGEESEGISLDKLGSNAFQKKQGKVREKLQEVANYLIDIAAKRALTKGFVCDGGADYEAFCRAFPYVETDDQMAAIEDIESDLTSGKPMDRLLCGDVGFGKTEVAQRAAFIVAASHKQVAVVVPTTLLCRQHFETFKKRFEKTPFRIQQLSRLLSSKEAQRVKQELKDGTIDILIATHAVLSKDVAFHDLGLVVVDEEQRFGVKQKERLKSFKAHIHVLSMSATPIPRTLQLTLTGVRELSLIVTPPMDRLAVRTFVMPFDAISIREAIHREIQRGGQVFYVSPRLKDLQKIFDMLKGLLPYARVAMVHGQMPVRELEELVSKFYARKFDILLATQIVEAGIDVASANTMIVHRSDLFGLSQLYQLRGRVGRSTHQGYVYFTTQPHKPLKDISEKRLSILQRLSGLGAGFSLASYDLEIRGAGNIVGEAQSGHIREVGVELYQDLLQEAILQQKVIQNEKNSSLDAHASDTSKSIKLWKPHINLGVAVMIPDTFVDDLDTRFDLYRKASHLKTKEDIHQFAADLRDRFGKLPDPVLFFLETLDMKNICLEANIDKVDVGPKGAVVQFYQNEALLPVDKMLPVLSPMEGKIALDQRLIFPSTWQSDKQKVVTVKNILKTLLHAQQKYLSKTHSKTA
jgi:transcription-repair coupling factor (superfamily II helicase)